MSSHSMDPELFVRTDGLPMAFLMGPTGYERQQVGGSSVIIMLTLLPSR